MKTCEAVIATRDGDQHDCGKEARFSAYAPPIFFCADCLHDCMQDTSSEEQATVEELDPQ